MNKYERLLRRLRADPRLWGDSKKSDQIGRLIDTLKLRCLPGWSERVRKSQEDRLERWFAIQ